MASLVRPAETCTLPPNASITPTKKQTTRMAISSIRIMVHPARRSLSESPAAPIYFPVYHTDYGDFVDGGLVANHPGFFAIIEAKQFLNTEESDISMLHIGTLSQRFTSDGRTNLGLLRWRTKLLNLLFSCQDQSVNQIVQFLLNDRYYSIDEIITE